MNNKLGKESVRKNANGRRAKKRQQKRKQSMTNQTPQKKKVN